MASILLSTGEALEIFCNLIDKSIYKGQAKKSWSNEAIKKAIDKYSLKEYSNDIAQKHKDEAGKLKINDNFIKLMAEGIKTGISFSVAKVSLNKALDLLNEDLIRDEEKFYTSDYEEVKNEIISNGQLSYENSHWLLLYNNHTKSKPVIEGISQGVISLLPFGRAVLKRPTFLIDNGREIKTKTYKGRYIVKAKDPSILSLSLKIDGMHRDLRMSFYVGQSNPRDLKTPQISLGIYTNIYEGKMECGAVCLKLVDDDNTIESIQKHDYKDLIWLKTPSSPGYNDIDKEIVFFFEKSKRNIVIKKHKITLLDLQDWLKLDN